jgi:hypothetical protein
MYCFFRTATHVLLFTKQALLDFKRSENAKNEILKKPNI